MRRVIFLGVVLMGILTSSCENNEKAIVFEHPFKNKVMLLNEKGIETPIHEQELLRDWEDNVYEYSGKDVRFVKSYLKEHENGIITLIATNEERTIKKAVVVSIEKGKVLYRKNNNSKCTCSGCTEGCGPKTLGNNEWSCTPCKNNGGCRKSVTVYDHSGDMAPTPNYP